MFIAKTAVVDPGAKIGRNVTIGDFTIVHPNVEIGDDSIIESHCVLGHPAPASGNEPLRIGRSSHIRSHSIFYANSTFGDGLTTGHRVTVRERTEAGLNLQIGTLSDFQGDLVIGDYVRTHSNVHLGKGTRVGNYVWIFPYTVMTNDPHPPSDHAHHSGAIVEDFAIIATMCTVLPGVRIGRGALVAAHALVNRDVQPDHIVAGVPAKDRGPTDAIKLTGTQSPAYPWRRHFHRGYPAASVAKWKQEFPDG